MKRPSEEGRVTSSTTDLHLVIRRKAAHEIIEADKHTPRLLNFNLGHLLVFILQERVVFQRVRVFIPLQIDNIAYLKITDCNQSVLIIFNGTHVHLL